MAFLELVNQLRDRFSEVHLDNTTWTTVVGFDQFSKDAINYAYSDILNAEIEWPFLHEKSSLTTIPGVQLYPVSSANASAIKEIDWESFFIAPNIVKIQISNEAAVISATLIVSPVNLVSWSSDSGVVYNSTSVSFLPVDRDPLVGQYTIKDGRYYFNVADVGVAINLNYTTTIVSTINVNTASHLYYMDYDLWRQTRLPIDLNDTTTFSQPKAVFKTQKLGEIGFTPTPDKIYIINFECWVDGPDLVAPTDVTLLPSRFDQVIIDGASKYCYEFREDPTQAQMADARFKAGIARMRIELINRRDDMKSGFRWRRRYSGGYSGW